VTNFLPLFAPGWERREGSTEKPAPGSAAVAAADETAPETVGVGAAAGEAV
jgi:hypothetical protein